MEASKERQINREAPKYCPMTEDGAPALYQRFFIRLLVVNICSPGLTRSDGIMLAWSTQIREILDCTCLCFYCPSELLLMVSPVWVSLGYVACSQIVQPVMCDLK